MPAELRTPSSVMYDCIKQFGGISKRDLASIVFSESYRYGGSPLVERLSERTFLSRQVTNTNPGTFPERAFADFPSSAQKVSAKILLKHSGQAGKDSTIAYFSGAACDIMCGALQALSLNDVLYRNATEHIAKMELATTADKVELLVLQFLTTGCLGDPTRATEITEEYSHRIVMSSFKTKIAQEGKAVTSLQDESKMKLGLCRIVNGKIRLPAHVLNADSGGTEIGSLATSPNAINDVGPNVSRRHLRIFRADDGQWYAVGMGSTNGTTVVRGDTRLETVIELPKRARSGAPEQTAIPIYPSDMLQLANDTQFMVLELI